MKTQLVVYKLNKFWLQVIICCIKILHSQILVVTNKFDKFNDCTYTIFCCFMVNLIKKKPL